VVDTGLHSKAWTVNQALAYLNTHTFLLQSEIDNLVDFILAHPGEILGYTIGKKKILEIRDQIRTAQTNFEIRTFNYDLLFRGPIFLNQFQQWEEQQNGE